MGRANVRAFHESPDRIALTSHVLHVTLKAHNQKMYVFVVHLTI